MGEMNNILNPHGNDNNFLFLASVIAHLCEEGPVTMDLVDIEKFWTGDITRLQYDIYDTKKITFSLKSKEENINEK